MRFNYKKINKRWIIALIGVIITACVCLIYAQSNIIQSDTVWHIKNGEWIIQNKSIPYKDYFSLHSTELNFMAHEWLFDVIIYLIDTLFGTMGIILFPVLTVLFGYGYICFKHFKKDVYTSLLSGIILLLFTVSNFFKPIMSIPDTLAVIILIILGGNLINTEKPFKSKLITNIILCVFLVNYHGGMMSANLVQTVFILGIICFNNKKIDKNSIWLLLSTVLSSLINPYFYKIYAYGFMINSSASEHILEWQPFKFNGVFSIFVVLITLIMAFIGYMEEYKDKGFILDIKFCLMFFYTVIMFRYTRGVNLFTYAILLFLAPYILKGIKVINAKYLQKRIINILFFIIFILTFVFSTISILSTIDKEEIPNESLNTYISKHYISTEVKNYLKDKKIFNAIEISGFLIYEDIPVFIDGRTDPYCPEYSDTNIYNEYILALDNPFYMNYLSDIYGFDVLVLPKNTLSTQMFLASKGWMFKYETENIYIIERVR